MNILSLKSIYDLYIETGEINELPTLHLAQDYLESFFSRIRSMNGNCENPPVTQFTSAFRKILIQNEITSSCFANCIDNLNLMTVSSRSQNKTNCSKNSLYSTSGAIINEEYFEFLQTIHINANDFLMNCYEESTIASIASSIEQKILRVGRFECDCQSALINDDKVANLTISDDIPLPCMSTFYVCKIAHILLNLCRKRFDFHYEYLITKILESIDFDNVFEPHFECDLSHKVGFMKYIAEEYVRIQATYIAKNLTLIEQKVICRKFLQKQIHFRGQ